MSTSPVSGFVNGERNRPVAEIAYLVAGGGGDRLVIRFSEAMGRLDDLYDATTNPFGARFGVLDPGTGTETFPTALESRQNGLGVVLTYAGAIDPAATLNVFGLTDLAGNVLFPVSDLSLMAEDPTTPALGLAPLVTAVSGVRNDTISIEFGVDMASWRLLDPAQYTLQASVLGTPIDLTDASFSFNGTNVVDIVMAQGFSFQSDTSYDLTLNVDPSDPLRSVQGVAIASSDASTFISVVGDVTNGPTQAGSRATLDPLNPNSIIVTFDESVDMTAALDSTRYDYDSGSIGIGVDPITDSSVRVLFAAPVAVAGVLEVLATAAVDNAGNAAAGTLSLAVTDDSTAPSISSVNAEVAEGFGGDKVFVVFSEDVDPQTVSGPLDFAVTSTVTGLPIRVGGVIYTSSDLTATLFTEDLMDGDTIQVSAVSVTDLSGNIPATAPMQSGLATGDSDPGLLVSAFVNREADSSGRVLDVLFSEDMSTNFVTLHGSWSIAGLATVLNVDRVGSDHIRILLDQAPAAGARLVLAAGATDNAGNSQSEQDILIEQ